MGSHSFQFIDNRNHSVHIIAFLIHSNQIYYDFSIHTVSKSWLERCLKLHQNLDITQYSSIKDNQLAQILKRCDKNHMKNINLSGCRNLTDKTLGELLK